MLAPSKPAAAVAFWLLLLLHVGRVLLILLLLLPLVVFAYIYIYIAVHLSLIGHKELRLAASPFSSPALYCVRTR